MHGVPAERYAAFQGGAARQRDRLVADVSREGGPRGAGLPIPAETALPTVLRGRTELIGVWEFTSGCAALYFAGRTIPHCTHALPTIDA